MITCRPSQEELCKEIRNRFLYDKYTGLFIYKVDIAAMKIGDIAGQINTNGHRQITINENTYMAHNLAWLYITGIYPEDFIVDHIDGNYDNNKWTNFRKCNNSQNQGNAKLRDDNKTGYRGVHFDKRKRAYIAQITINKKRIWLGQRSTAREAYEIYLKAAKEHFGEFYYD